MNIARQACTENTNGWGLRMEKGIRVLPTKQRGELSIQNNDWKEITGENRRRERG